MAGLICQIPFEDVPTIAGSFKQVASLKTPANQMAKILKVAFHLDGVAGDAKMVSCRFKRSDPASGTPTTSQAAVKNNDAFTITPQCSGRVNFPSGTPATLSGDPLYPFKVHPQGGKIEADLSYEDFTVKNAGEVMLEVKVESAQVEVKISGSIIYEE